MPPTDSKTQSQTRFGRFAERYVASPSHAAGWDLDRLLELAAPQPGWLALDVATGGGHTALKLAPHVGRMIASDLTERMLRAAGAHFASRDGGAIELLAADAEELPLPAGSLDLVTCRIAPHHFERPERFVQEAARVLRPGGRLVVQDQLMPADAEAARVVNAFERLRDPSHHEAYDAATWRALFESAGLRVEATDEALKRHNLVDWAQRQDCDDATIAELVRMVEQAPDAALEWMQPLEWGSPAGSFAIHHILIAGRRRA